MKNNFTLIICLLLLQTAFAAPKDGRNESQPQSPEVPPSAHLVTPPEWSVHYSLMFLSEVETQNTDVKVYPNPVNRKDDLNINLSGAGKKYLSFYDITGKMVKKVETEKNAVTINVADLGVGVYILNVKSATVQTTKKVIIR